MYPGRATNLAVSSFSQRLNDIERLQLSLFSIPVLLLFRHLQSQSLVSHIVIRCIAFVFHPAESLPFASLFSDTPIV